MSCFITYHTISSAVPYPWRIHAPAMDFGITSSNSVRRTLSTAQGSLITLILRMSMVSPTEKGH